MNSDRSVRSAAIECFGGNFQNNCPFFQKITRSRSHTGVVQIKVFICKNTFITVGVVIRRYKITKSIKTTGNNSYTVTTHLLISTQIPRSFVHQRTVLRSGCFCCMRNLPTLCRCCTDSRSNLAVFRAGSLRVSTLLVGECTLRHTASIHGP